MSLTAFSALANWQRRRDIVSYCVSVVDHSLDQKKEALQVEEDPATLRRVQAAKYSEEVKVSVIPAGFTAVRFNTLSATTSHK
jgi:hypothetical protein